MNNTKYLVWSFEHDAWWKGSWNGYTKKIEEAGVYDYEVAYKICLSANRGLSRGVFPNEAMIPFNPDNDKDI